jgi:putative addiction module killer protein
MVEVLASDEFNTWLESLRDAHAKVRITVRLSRVELGNFGDVKAVGAGISEMRISYGPGYRIYFMQRGTTVVVLLCGGDKSTQRKDIARAKEMSKDWKG